jgi:hypothetical protein
MTAADVTAVVSAVDYTTIITGLAGIAAAVVVVLVAWRGAKILLGAVRGG